MLEALGVDPEAEKTYLVLAGLKTGAADDLAKRLDQEPDVVAEHLVGLAGLGLAVNMGTGVYEAVPLPSAVKALRARRVADLDAAAAAADTLHTQILASRESQTDAVRLLVGRDEINASMDKVCSASQHEIAAFDKPPYVNHRAATAEWLGQHSPEWQALRRGVSVRAVYHPGFNSERRKEFSLFAGEGERARVGHVPMKLILVDTRVALIPAMKSYEPGHELRATLIMHPTLVEALGWLFQAVWDRSVALSALDLGTGANPRRDKLIQMLMSGIGDIGIASELEVNERTVRRWVAELMEELEVKTRLQLGAALAKSVELQHDTTGLD